MTFSYNSGIPAAANNPSNDQPLMLINTASIAGIIAVDHVGFEAAGGGQHQQVNFNNKVPQGVQADPGSVLFTANGTAQSIAQLQYKNQNSTFPINSVVAYGFISATGTIVNSQSYNIASVSNPSTGRYNIVLTANVVPAAGPSSTTFGVIITPQGSSSTVSAIANYSITGAGAFTVFINAVSASTLNPGNDAFSFIVIQI